MGWKANCMHIKEKNGEQLHHWCAKYVRFTQEQCTLHNSNSGLE